MLLKCQPGTFIVRFTESEPGGVSIVWVKSKCICCVVCRSVVNVATFVNIHSASTCHHYPPR